jgi:hypothetical protein
MEVFGMHCDYRYRLLFILAMASLETLGHCRSILILAMVE